MLERFRNTLHEFERTGLDALAAILPWIAPLSTAYITWGNVQTYLNFSVVMAWIMAIVAEGLGLVTIHTTYQMWITNARAQSEDREPTIIAALSSGFYLAVIIVINVILEVGHTEPVKIIAKALISMISVVAGVVLALRTRHAVRLLAAADAQVQAEREAERQRRAEELAALQRAEAEARRAELAILERQQERDAQRAYKLKKLELELGAESSGRPLVASTGQPESTGRATGRVRSATGRPLAASTPATGQRLIGDVKQFREIMATASNGDRPTGQDDLVARFGVPRTNARRWWGEWEARSRATPASAPPGGDGA